jgi:hypothetical protein
VNAQTGGDGGADVGKLLAEDRVESVVAGCAPTVTLRHVQAEQTELASRQPYSTRNASLLNYRFVLTQQMSVGEVTNHLTESVVISGVSCRDSSSDLTESGGEVRTGDPHACGP